MQRREGRALGSTLRLLVGLGDDARTVDEAWLEVVRAFDDVDRAMSRYRADSELTLLNRRRGGAARVSRLLAAALATAERARRLTAGRFDPRVVVECDENDQMQAFVAGGLGVALWPHLALAHVRPDIVVRPVVGAQVERRVWAATLADAYKSEATEAMLAILRETAEEFKLTAPLRVA